MEEQKFVALIYLYLIDILYSLFSWTNKKFSVLSSHAPVSLLRCNTARQAPSRTGIILYTTENSAGPTYSQISVVEIQLQLPLRGRFSDQISD
jgi:hypothetical protein